MESKSHEIQGVECRHFEGHYPAEDRQGFDWLDLARKDQSSAVDTGAYENAACAVDPSDCETPSSDGHLEHEEKFYSAMDLDKDERVVLSPAGSDQNLIEYERLEVEVELETSPSRDSRGSSVQFQERPNDIPKSLIRDETDKTSTCKEDAFTPVAPQRLLDRKSFENKCFTDDWQTDALEWKQNGTRDQTGKAKCGIGSGELSSNDLDNNSSAKDRDEAKKAGKGGAAKSGGKTEMGYRISLRRILRHFSERRERLVAQNEGHYFNGQSSSILHPSIISPTVLASRRQSEGDAHGDFAAWSRRSSLHLVNGSTGMCPERWQVDGKGKTNGFLEAGTTTPRRSSVTMTTHFGCTAEVRTKTEVWSNGHLDPIPSVSHSIKDDGAVEGLTATTVIQIIGGGSVEGSSAEGEVQPAMIADTGETFFRLLLETVLPFIMAGFGCAFAGIVLDIVQHWQVFLEIGEIFILVPSLLGLKGNLEMTQASRLSTQANLGHLDTTKEQLKLIGASLALTQVQSIVVAFMASIVAILLGWIPAGKFDLLHGILLCTSSVITASIASLVLGSVMVGVVLVSRRFHINPDNVATPFGGSLGDLTTITLLSNVAMILFTVMENHVWVAPVLLCFWLALTPVWWTVASHHNYTRNVLRTGWVPVIGAMAISSVGGLVLDMAVEKFEGIAVFQPVVNGVGGNLVAVQASRLATALHRTSVLGVLPANAVRCCPNVFTTFFGKGTGSKTARVLMLMVIPGHIIFMFAIEYLKNGCSTITPAFAVIYLAATVIQVATLLYVANFIVHWLWSRGNDPDNYSIPYLTAVGDLLGGLLLAAAFYLLTVIGDANAEPKN